MERHLTAFLASAFSHFASVLKGRVSTEMLSLFWGVAGHAGLFATAPQLRSLVSQILFGDSASPLGKAPRLSSYLPPFTTSQSSRALGWDTNDYRANSYRGCGNLSAVAFTHRLHRHSNMRGSSHQGRSNYHFAHKSSVSPSR